MKGPLDTVDLGAESGEDLQVSTAALTARLEALRERMRELGLKPADSESMRLRLDEAALLLELEQDRDAHGIGLQVLELALQSRDWEQAAAACDLVVRCGHDDALEILGQGVWLAVTFPVEPELSVALLQHIIDETPDDADGAAVAAATAAYIVDLRTEGRKRDDLGFFATQLLGDVARRHGQVNDQQQFDDWVNRLELDEPDKFLVRLRNVVDVLVQDNWLFDRDQLRAELPVQ